MKRKKSLLFVAVVAVFFIYYLRITFDTSKLDNLNDGKVTVIGHAGRGFASWIPFNSLPSNSYKSLTKAILEDKADGVEVDVHMTSDNEFVLYHDEKLDFKTNASGCISENSLEQVIGANYQLGAPFDWFQNEKVCSLEKLLNFFKTQKEFPELHLDIRNKSACLSAEENAIREEKVAMNLIRFLNSMEVPAEKVVIISLSHEFTDHLMRLKSPYSVSFEMVGNFDENFEWIKQKGMKSVTIKPRLLTKELSAKIHKDGLQVITFGAKSKSGNKKLLELNPDVIQTNNIDALKELLQE